MINKRVGEHRYLVQRHVGEGSFGVVYAGVDTLRGGDVAIKLEKAEDYDRLHYEYVIYRNLGPGPGLAGRLNYYREDKYNILIMELLGPSLEDLHEFCFRHFTVKTVLMLADRMIEVLDYVHSRGYIHRDIKPDNFLMGYRAKSNNVYLVDFGLARKYLKVHNTHLIQYEENMSFVGTARFASLGTHLGFQQSQRDDLESLAYCLIYFLLGKLPWQSSSSAHSKQRCEIIYEKKYSAQSDELCKGYPVQFACFLDYCRNLKYGEIPDYIMLRDNFKSLLKTLSHEYDLVYDWRIIKEKLYQTEKNRAIKSRYPEGQCSKPRQRGKNNWFHVLEMKECRNPNAVIVRGKRPGKKCRNKKIEDTRSGDPVLKDDDRTLADYGHLVC